MKTLIRSIDWQQAVVTDVMPFAVSLLAVEQLVHLGSFSLECIVFLAGWQGLKLGLKTLFSGPRS